MPFRCRAKGIPGSQFAAFALWAIFSAMVSLAKEPVPVEDSNVRIVEDKTRDGGTTISAVLKNCTEATISLSLTLENATPSCPVPLVVDAAGRSRVELVTVSPTEKRRRWSYQYQYAWKPGRRGEVKASTHAYALPYNSGRRLVIQADFGKFSHQPGSADEHAIDWDMPVGTPVLAARAGTVVALRSDADAGGEDLRYKNSYNYIILRHDDGTFAEYCHLRKDGVLVKLGQQVKVQERIGLSGNTGFSSRPHLHFSVFQTIDGKTRRTLPIQFKTAEGKVETLVEGKEY
jgi:murein DD-endopeptidase MepM/ murein hydrolase activator NlpD